MLVLTMVGAILGKASVHRHAVDLEIMAEQFDPTTAVETAAACFCAVRNDAVANLESAGFRPEGSNHADGFVA